MPCPIQGFLFHVDTGDAKPICCKAPRYNYFEQEVIKVLTGKLAHNGMVQQKLWAMGIAHRSGLQGGQENIPWWDFIWRLCVSFCAVNRITRPFKFPFRQCDDAVIYIGCATYCISINMDSRYWQVPMELRSWSKMAFFGVQEKLTWTTMPMEALNAAPLFA